jgi:hypothetical protein
LVASKRTVGVRVQNLPDTPIVLTSPGLELSWEGSTGPYAVTTLLGQPTGARLDEAIQAALANRVVADAV